MAVSMTEAAVLSRQKTVTRHAGWEFARPGQEVCLCRMGRREDEPLVRLAVVIFLEVRRERLDAITPEEVELEGCAPMSPDEFVEFFVAGHKGTTPESEVTRMRWHYVGVPVEDGHEVDHSRTAMVGAQHGKRGLLVVPECGGCGSRSSMVKTMQAKSPGGASAFVCMDCDTLWWSDSREVLA